MPGYGHGGGTSGDEHRLAAVQRHRGGAGARGAVESEGDFAVKAHEDAERVGVGRHSQFAVYFQAVDPEVIAVNDFVMAGRHMARFVAVVGADGIVHRLPSLVDMQLAEVSASVTTPIVVDAVCDVA